MPDLCSELDHAIQENLAAQRAYTEAQAALGLSVTDRLERDLALDLLGFVLGETRHHEQTLRNMQRRYCLPGG